MASREIKIELKVQKSICVWIQDCLEAHPLSTLQADLASACFLPVHTVTAIETKIQLTVSNSLWCALLSKRTGRKCCVFFFKLRQRSRHFRLRRSRWLPENGKEFRKMKGEAACGLWKRDKNPRANEVLYICGAERFWVAKVCRHLPSHTFAGILLVLLQQASHCKFNSKHKCCTSAII